MGKKIVYISMSLERAHGIQIIKTCEAFVKRGALVELWTAVAGNISDLRAEPFVVKFAPILDFLPKSWRLNFYIKSVSFFISVFFMLLKTKEDFIIYTRDEIILFLCFLTKRKIFWEAHMPLLSGFLRKERIKEVCGTVAISEKLKNIISEKYGVAKDKIIAAHDGVDLKEFNVLVPKKEARASLKIDNDKKVVVYVGSIFKRKGVFTLLETAALLDESWLFLIVGGGQDDDLEEAERLILKRGLKNVFLAGYIPHKNIAQYLAAADVLALPNSALDERTRDFTSPLKLFEYMASGRPIIASATPTILEVLNDYSAVLVKPDSPEDFKNKLLQIFSDKERAEALALRARKDVENYTWEKRTEKILDFLEQYERK